MLSKLFLKVMCFHTSISSVFHTVFSLTRGLGECETSVLWVELYDSIQVVTYLAIYQKTLLIMYTIQVATCITMNHKTLLIVYTIQGATCPTINQKTLLITSIVYSFQYSSRIGMNTYL